MATDLRPRWTRKEISILKRLYRSHSNQAIADAVGRSVSSVVFKAFYMGLKKGPRRLAEKGRSNIAKRWNK